MTYSANTEDLVWSALGDSKRRCILEALATGPKLTGELVELLPSIGRTGVLRHIGILAEADLIRVRPEGRKRWNYLNPAPIKLVCNSWVTRHIDGIHSSMNRLKDLAETETTKSQGGEMTDIKVTDAKIIKYKFEVNIARSPEDVWSLMTENIDAWWMQDFRALGEKSTVSLRPKTGGLLLEETPEGGSLEWYRVQMCTPGAALYLVGYMAPDWGGPTISMLKLGIEAREQGSALIVSDALMGNVTESSAKNAAGGWETLFGDGFKNYAQSST